MKPQDKLTLKTAARFINLAIQALERVEGEDTEPECDQLIETRLSVEAILVINK